jgi:hypothetical protein
MLMEHPFPEKKFHIVGIKASAFLTGFPSV